MMHNPVWTRTMVATQRVISGMLLILLSVAPSWGGQFFEQDGIAIRGYDPVAYFTSRTPMQGVPEFHAVFQGSTFYFASAIHRDIFLANPEKFSPQYGGFCAYGMAKGYKASTDPVAFTVVGEKLYLNYSGTVRALWIFDISGYVKKADHNWPALRLTTRVTP